MATVTPFKTPPDVSGLIAAIGRNKDDSCLTQFLAQHRWSVLAGYIHPAELKRGHVLITQGAQDRKLYFLESGSLKVDIRTDAGLSQLAILGPGTVVGEGSFFSHLSRNASVVAYSECKVWTMSPEDFATLSKEHTAVALALAMALGAVLATRMLDMSRRFTVT